MAKKITVASNKGGVGKTTTAKNVAAALAMANFRTLLIDLDQQANATEGLGFDPLALSATIVDLFSDGSLDPVSVVVATDIPNLHLLPAHPELSDIEVGIAVQRAQDPKGTGPDPRMQLKAIIAVLDEHYDFVVIDTPPSLGYMTINALAATDEVIVPVAMSAYSAKGVMRTLQAVERARQTYNPSLQVPRILITKVKRTNASDHVLSDIKQAHLDRVLPQLIVEATAVDEAEQVGQPVVLYDPTSPAAQGYKRVAEMMSSER